jgi:sn-glycerol 3-phosphate transport system substrate-binding protein
MYQNAVAEAVKKGSKEFEWGIAPLPQNTAKPTAIVVGSNIAMLKSVPAKQQAVWLFMRWLMNAKVSAEWTQAAGVLPARLGARDYLTSFYLKVPQYKQAIEDVLPSARPEPNVRNTPDVRELIETAIAAFESDRNNPNKAKAVLDDAAGKATVLVGEKR